MYNFSTNKTDWLWQLADGRYYSTRETDFVDSAFVDEWLARSGLAQVPASPVDETGEHSERGLREGLAFYGLALGPLAPLPTLEEARADALERLKIYRQGVEAAGFEYQGRHWDSEQKDELRLNSAYKIFEAGLTEYPGWKISDGVYITLTLEILQGASMAFMHHTGRAFAVEQAKSVEIAALDTAGAVLAWMETELEKGWDTDETTV